MIESLLVTIKIKLYPFLHSFICSGDLEILIPKPEYTKKSGDNEVYMLCSECGKKFHLIYLEPEDESHANEDLDSI